MFYPPRVSVFFTVPGLVHQLRNPRNHFCDAAKIRLALKDAFTCLLRWELFMPDPRIFLSRKFDVLLESEVDYLK